MGGCKVLYVDGYPIVVGSKGSARCCVCVCVGVCGWLTAGVV